jgi:hypothetical protein
MTATLANITCGAFLDEQAMPRSGLERQFTPVASLERPCTPIERPTVNKPRHRSGGTSRGQLLVMDRRPQPSRSLPLPSS